MQNFTSVGFSGEAQEELPSPQSASTSSNDDDDEEYLQSIQENTVCLKAEYAFEMSKNSKLQSDMERQDVRFRRRQKILGYYDDYIFNVALDDDDTFDLEVLVKEMDGKDIDSDYKNCIRIIQTEMQKSLEEEDDREWEQMRKAQDRVHRPKHETSMSMTSFVDRVAQIATHRPRSKSAAHIHRIFHLYRVSEEDQEMEKEWMRRLRKARFRVWATKQRNRRLRIIKRESESRLPELDMQIEMKEKMEQLNALKSELDAIKESRIKYIQNSSKELDKLRGIIRSLNTAE